jgi:hypothetical protein
MDGRPVALVLYWSHPTDVVKSIAAAIAQAIDLCGLDSQLCHCDERERIAAIVASGDTLRLVVAMGAIPLHLTHGPVPLHRAVRCPYHVLFLDPFVYEFQKFEACRGFLADCRTQQNLRILSLDRSYGRFLDRLTGHRSIDFPYGAFPAPLGRDARQGRCVVFGNISQQLSAVEHGSADAVVAALAPPDLDGRVRVRLAERLRDPEAPSNVLQLVCDAFGDDLDRALRPDVLQLVVSLDSFEKRRRRIDAVRQLEGLPVDFFGEGWAALFPHCATFRHFGSVPFNQIGMLMQFYSVVVSFDPNWDEGLHDRVFTGVGSGCRVLTTKSRAVADAALGRDRVFEFSPSVPQTRDLAQHALSLPPADREETLDLRLRNSWTSRVDRYMADQLS